MVSHSSFAWPFIEFNPFIHTARIGSTFAAIKWYRRYLTSTTTETSRQFRHQELWRVAISFHQAHKFIRVCWLGVHYSSEALRGRPLGWDCQYWSHAEKSSLGWIYCQRSSGECGPWKCLLRSSCSRCCWRDIVCLFCCKPFIASTYNLTSSPISLFMATLVIFLWRPIMEELASALPISGAPYTYMYVSWTNFLLLGDEVLAWFF